jgi:EPS-associated MarR family transcriptional regulator
MPRPADREPSTGGILGMLNDATRYKLLSLLHESPEISQRELASKLGVSLGKTNYCLKALIDRGLIKAQNFQNSRKKAAYLYKLTPAGMAEKIQVTRRFLAIKLREHEELTTEIARLRSEVQSQNRLADSLEGHQTKEQQ